MLKECDVRNWQEAVASVLVAAFEATFVLLDKHRAEVGMGYLYEVLCAMLEVRPFRRAMPYSVTM